MEKIEIKKRDIKKSDIKTGMMVRTSDGVLRLVIGGTLVSYIGGGGIPLNWYDDDLNLEEKVEYKKNEIVQIFEEPNFGEGFTADLSFWLAKEHFITHAYVLFDKDAIVKKMTVDEIERSLRRSDGKAISLRISNIQRIKDV